MIRAFDALVNLCIAIGENPIQGFERKSHLTQLITYQLFREQTNLTEPGMGKLTSKGEEIKQNPHLRRIVNTSVCKRFLALLQEECIKPYLINDFLERSNILQQELLDRAEALRKEAKSGQSEDLRSIQLFDAQGYIRDNYVIQALRSTPFGTEGKMLWDEIKDTPELKMIRKDAGEFSALSAVTSKKVEEDARVVLVTKDTGAKQLFEAAYKDKFEDHLKAIDKQRRKTEIGKKVEEQLLLPYPTHRILKNQRPHLTITDELGFSMFCNAVASNLNHHKGFIEKMQSPVASALSTFAGIAYSLKISLNTESKTQKSPIEIASILDIPRSALKETRSEHSNVRNQERDS